MSPEQSDDPRVPEPAMTPMPPKESADDPSAAAVRPVPESQRIFALDVLRGFALLGIFMVNMQFFAQPFMHAVADPAVADAPLADKASWFFVKAFCEYKFISMFSLLFGIGMIVQTMRVQAKGRSFAPYYLRRTGILALFGLAHALLLWYGDILFIYACISLVLFLMRGLSARTLIIVAVWLVAGSLFLSTTCASLQVWTLQVQAEQAAAAPEQPEEPATGVEADPPRGWAAVMAAGFDPSQEAWARGERLAYREGPFGDVVAFRSVTYGFALIAGVFSYGWHVLVMFILGAALMKLDFFAPGRRAWHRKFLLIGGLVGVPLECLSASIFVWSGFDPGWMLLAVNVLHEVGAYSLCLAYVGGMTLLANSGAARWLMTAMASIGRTALSNYILQTVAATFLMYWWGLAWFDEVSRPEMIGIVLVIYAGQLVTSRIWLSVFSIGPLEWLWRSLTYLRPQPMLRR